MRLWFCAKAIIILHSSLCSLALLLSFAVGHCTFTHLYFPLLITGLLRCLGAELHYSLINYQFIFN